jgi:3-deoxy-manno-octulosonate cytidylyltransferase (CMP-KDO synthetase)
MNRVSQAMLRQESHVGAPAFADFLRDKSCVLVGPAAYLEGKALGGWIDGHDVVVRVNWGDALARSNPQDYGSRTDVLYKRLLKLGKVEHVDVDGYEQGGVQWVVAVDQSAISENVRHMREALNGRIAWLLDVHTRGQLRAEMRTSPLIGMIAVDSLLKHAIPWLDMVGFDFYETAYGAGYGGTAYREYMQRPVGVIGKTHDADRNLLWLVRRRNADPRLHFDDNLQEVAALAKVSVIRPSIDTRGVVAVIPARYESSRFPGKPLAKINGREMILHVCDRVSQAITDVVVATDDRRIADVVTAAGYKVAMTGPAMTGTDRVAQVAVHRKALYYVNVQGDEPLVSPAAIRALIKAKKQFPRDVVGAMTRLEEGDPAAEARDVVKVAVHSDGRLAYCSRLPIAGAQWRQLGLYAFTRQELLTYAHAGKRGVLEAREDVEILRFLEKRVGVRMVDLHTPATQAVDRPEDILKVEALMPAAELVAV